MNRAEKINRLVDKFGGFIDIFKNENQAVFGQLQIANEGNKWRVTFITHGGQSFFADGMSWSVFFSKYDGGHSDNYRVSILSYKDSVSDRQDYTDEEMFLNAFSMIATMIDLAYLMYFSE